MSKVPRGIDPPASGEQAVIVKRAPTVGERLADMGGVGPFKIHATFVVAGNGDLLDFLRGKFRIGQGGEFGDLGLYGFSIGRNFLDQSRDNAFDRRLGKVPEASQL